MREVGGIANPSLTECGGRRRKRTGFASAPYVWVLVTAALILGLCLVFVLFLATEPSRVYATLRNGGASTLEDLILTFTGGSNSFPSLPADTWVRVGVDVAGESSLEIDFTDSDGHRHVRDLDVYIEPGY